jgi:general L-amino acid transport system permease protein
MSDTHAQTAFVRTEMLPEQTPPVTQTGAIKWLRENLFSSWINAILTMISLYVIYWVISHISFWMFNGIWDASSLSECREIRDATYGEGSNVACWAVLTDRWDQLMFGFYPPEFYWRPDPGADPVPRGDFAGALRHAAAQDAAVHRDLALRVVLAPLGRHDLGADRGGSGLRSRLGGDDLRRAGHRAARRDRSRRSSCRSSTGSSPRSHRLRPWEAPSPIGIEFVPSDDFGGFMLAFVIGIAGIILSLPLGIVLALGRQSDLFIINKFSVIFIEVIRGVPLIVWLFTASLLLNYFLPPGTNFDLMLRVIIMVTLFSAAYIAEVVRGGLAALPRGQYEGADSLGLDYWQSMRLIILPQALKISIPGIVSTFIGLFKDTTLVVFIGLLDPVGLSNAIRATTDWNGIYWELFIFIGLCFFICCYSMSRYSQWLERKLRTDHR